MKLLDDSNTRKTMARIDMFLRECIGDTNIRVWRRMDLYNIANVLHNCGIALNVLINK